jgi:NADH:ubiquinone oxidoreductase subunit K
MGLQAYLILAATIFAIGLFGVMTRRNTIGILLGIELMLNAVNINLVAFSRFNADLAGMVLTVFAISITVAEVAVGLALVIVLFRTRRTAMADHIDWLKG